MRSSKCSGWRVLGSVLVDGVCLKRASERHGRWNSKQTAVLLSKGTQAVVAGDEDNGGKH